jgi:hypothetical protein
MKRTRIIFITPLLFPLLFLSLLVLLFGGCASSSGALFESAAASSMDEEKEDESEQYEAAEEGLRISTSPSRARIRIDGVDYGRSPLLLELSTGNYRITASKSGYYDESASVSFVEGEYREVRLDLEAITGLLLVETEPSGAEVRSGFKKLASGRPEKLRIGTYQIEVSAFGFEPFRTMVTIEEDETTFLKAVLEKAPFRIDYFSAVRERFDPADPGRYGSAEASVSVSGPGRGFFTVYGPDGLIVHGPEELSFTERWSRLSWNGRGSGGTVLPEGSYLLYISVEDGERRMEEKAPVVIDHSIDLRVRPVYGGAAGTLFCPLPGALPAGTFQGGILALAHAEGADYLIPVVASIRFAPALREEIVLSGGLIARSPGDSIPFGSLSWSLPAWHVPLFSPGGGSFSGSLLAKGSWFYRSLIDPLGSFTGISAAMPVAVKTGPVTFALAPELTASTGSDAVISVWGYAKAAMILDAGPLSLALSSSLRSTPFDSGFQADWPLSSGCELNWILPGKLISISAAATLDWDPETGWYLSGGGGIWLLP